MKHYVLDGKEVVEFKGDLIEWAKTFETMDRVVAKTDIGGDISVSTVFLGLDHAFGSSVPVLFESLVFLPDEQNDKRRYHTWAEAETGHLELVDKYTQIFEIAQNLVSTGLPTSDDELEIRAGRLIAREVRRKIKGLGLECQEDRGLLDVQFIIRGTRAKLRDLDAWVLRHLS